MNFKVGDKVYFNTGNEKHKNKCYIVKEVHSTLAYIYISSFENWWPMECFNSPLENMLEQFLEK